MLMRFDPFREMDRLTQMASEAAQTPRSFPLDAYRRGEEFIVQFDLPGVDASSIDLTVERNVLTVKGERRFQRQENDEVIAAERPQGVFTRQLFLGDTLDGERISAAYHDGVLTLTSRSPSEPSRARSRSRRRAGRRRSRRTATARSRATARARSSPAWPATPLPDVGFGRALPRRR